MPHAMSIQILYRIVLYCIVLYIVSRPKSVNRLLKHDRSNKEPYLQSVLLLLVRRCSSEAEPSCSLSWQNYTTQHPTINHSLFAINRNIVKQASLQRMQHVEIAANILFFHTLNQQFPFNGLFSRTTWVSRHQSGKPLWILMKQEMMGGSDIS